MKVVTANRLSDGAVIYLAQDGQWTDQLSQAARHEAGDADAALEAARARVTEIADVYLIDVDDAGTPAGREALRETIRKSGPTVRDDLGYQAETRS